MPPSFLKKYVILQMYYISRVRYLALFRGFFCLFGFFGGFFLYFLLFVVDFVWWFIQTFINTHLAVYLNWRRDSTAKGAKKNTSPNVIHLQYSVHGLESFLNLRNISAPLMQNSKGLHTYS